MIGFSCTIMVSTNDDGGKSLILLTGVGDMGRTSYHLQRRTAGRWPCRSCLWVSLLLGWLYRRCRVSRRAHQPFSNRRWTIPLDFRARASQVSQFYLVDHWLVIFRASSGRNIKWGLTTASRLASRVRMAGRSRCHLLPWWHHYSRHDRYELSRLQLSAMARNAASICRDRHWRRFQHRPCTIASMG